MNESSGCIPFSFNKGMGYEPALSFFIMKILYTLPMVWYTKYNIPFFWQWKLVFSERWVGVTEHLQAELNAKCCTFRIYSEMETVFP